MEAPNGALRLPPAPGLVSTQAASTRPQQGPVSLTSASVITLKTSFRHTLLNVGNTCFFNSVLQVIASLPPFVEAIENIQLPPDHEDSSYCIAFLKLFIPAIATPSLEPNRLLDVSSVTREGWTMTQEDWKDFVYRLATKFDAKYTMGGLCRPGGLARLLPRSGGRTDV